MEIKGLMMEGQRRRRRKRRRRRRDDRAGGVIMMMMKRWGWSVRGEEGFQTLKPEHLLPPTS